VSENDDRRVIRFVITNPGRDKMEGLRVLTLSGQGRDTFATRKEAEDYMKLLQQPGQIDRVIGITRAKMMRVYAVECWPGHFDPKRTVWEGNGPTCLYCGAETPRPEQDVCSRNCEDPEFRRGA
jgi:hypothetical protein